MYHPEAKGKSEILPKRERPVQQALASSSAKIDRKINSRSSEQLSDVSARKIITRIASIILAEENYVDFGKAVGLTFAHGFLINHVPHLIASAAEEFSEGNQVPWGLLSIAILSRQLLPIIRDKLLIGISMRSAKRMIMDAADALMNKRGLTYHIDTQKSDKAILFNKSMSLPGMLCPLLTQFAPSAIQLAIMAVGVSRQYGSTMGLCLMSTALASMTYSTIASKHAMDKRTRYLNSGRQSYRVYTHAVLNSKNIHDAGRSASVMQSLDKVTTKLSEYGVESQTSGLSINCNNIGIIASLIAAVSMLINFGSGGASLFSSSRDIIILISYISLFLDLLPRLGEATSHIISSYPNVKDVVSVLIEPSGVVDPYPDRSLKLKGRGAEIKFEDVMFSHQKYTIKPACDRKLSLLISSGKRVALVGRSGSGKSTVLNLLSRYYSPQQGRITIDNVDIAKVGLSALREKISVVVQKPHLFKGSVRDNILFYVNDSMNISDRQILDVVEQFGLQSFISDLKQGKNVQSGLDVQVGEDGEAISGGQRQLVTFVGSMVRCRYGGAHILLLDEFTSALSADFAKSVLQGLKALDVTVVAITHKLQEIEDFDSIVVLDDGAVIAQGSHEKLMSDDDGCLIYQELYLKSLVDNTEHHSLRAGKVGFFKTTREHLRTDNTSHNSTEASASSMPGK